jgi:hypothetical protein
MHSRFRNRHTDHPTENATGPTQNATGHLLASPSSGAAPLTGPRGSG